MTKLREGFEGVERSFVGILERNGIKRADPTGQPFDPNLHQAMAEQPTAEHPPGTVMQAWTAGLDAERPAAAPGHGRGRQGSGRGDDAAAAASVRPSRRAGLHKQRIADLVRGAGASNTSVAFTIGRRAVLRAARRR